jgi:hypothetical protein
VTTPTTVSGTGSIGLPCSSKRNATPARVPTGSASRSAVRGVTAISPGPVGSRPELSLVSASGPVPESPVTWRYSLPSCPPASTRPAASATPGSPAIAASSLVVTAPSRTTRSTASGVPLRPSSRLRSVMSWASTVA